MPEAEIEVERLYGWIVERSPLHGPEWFNGLVDAIESLRNNPQRCPIAPESPKFEEEIRQLLYGKRKGVYRVLFTIRGRAVEVLHVRHGAQRHLTR